MDGDRDNEYQGKSFCFVVGNERITSRPNGDYYWQYRCQYIKFILIIVGGVRRAEV